MTHPEESGNLANSTERTLFSLHLFCSPGGKKVALGVSQPISQALNGCATANSRASSRPTMLTAVDASCIVQKSLKYMYFDTDPFPSLIHALSLFNRGFTTSGVSLSPPGGRSDAHVAILNQFPRSPRNRICTGLLLPKCTFYHNRFCIPFPFFTLTLEICNFQQSSRYTWESGRLHFLLEMEIEPKHLSLLPEKAHFIL